MNLHQEIHFPFLRPFKPNRYKFLILALLILNQYGAWLYWEDKNWKFYQPPQAVDFASTVLPIYGGVMLVLNMLFTLPLAVWAQILPVDPPFPFIALLIVDYAVLYWLLACFLYYIFLIPVRIWRKVSKK